MAFMLFHTLAPTSGTISPKTSGTLLLSLLSKANSRHFSFQNISATQRVCVCVCVCIFCINVLYCKAFEVEVRRTCLHYVLAFSFFLYTFFVANNISISMYIMCVILCLFSASSHRVGALQISIIIYYYY